MAIAVDFVVFITFLQQSIHNSNKIVRFKFSRTKSQTVKLQLRLCNWVRGKRDMKNNVLLSVAVVIVGVFLSNVNSLLNLRRKK